MGATPSGRRSGLARARGAAASARRAAPALLLLGALLASGCGDSADRAPDLPGALYEPPRPAPALRLSGAAGPYDLAAERGRVVLVFFGFTNCPDICPATLENWAKVRALLGEDAARVRFLFVSVDPKRDTPEIAAGYAARFDSTFVGVAGTEAEIADVALAWGVTVGGGPEEIVHASQVFLVDAEGRLRWGYGRSVTTEQIAGGVRSFLPRAG
ncbi:MAG TPA: SCO family protein [Acidobacteriota bacterium]|nr:SCO family protein [Acidobacteriota bacterium]